MPRPAANLGRARAVQPLASHSERKPIPSFILPSARRRILASFLLGHLPHAFRTHLSVDARLPTNFTSFLPPSLSPPLLSPLNPVIGFFAAISWWRAVPPLAKLLLSRPARTNAHCVLHPRQPDSGSTRFLCHRFGRPITSTTSLLPYARRAMTGDTPLV